MHSTTRQRLLLLACTALFVSTASAQWGWGGGSGRYGDGDGCPPWWADGECDDDSSDGDSSSNTSADPSQYGLTESTYNTSNKVITIHALLACLVWVLFIPVGGILLRIGIKSPIILRIHALLQIVSFVIYVAAVALGIWLIRMLSYGPYSLWSDPHTKLGITILAIAFLQPILGYVHHKIFKRRVEDEKAGRTGKKPGRTVPGYFHLWIGRLLIVLGMINGGLGLRLAAQSPFATNQKPKTIVYGVASAIMFLVYVIIVIRFEWRKSKQDREVQEESSRMMPLNDVPPQYAQPPSYVESEESLRKGPETTVRY